MARYTLTLQEDHLAALKAQVFPDNGQEATAYLLCGRADIARDPWTGLATRRLLSFDVVPLEEANVLSSSDSHIRSRTGTFAKVLRRARQEDLSVVVVHSHPAGFDSFSPIDDREEPCLLELAQHRNGPEAEVGSLVLTRGGETFGRIWTWQGMSTPVSLISVVGKRLCLHYPGRTSGATPDALQRQALAFGRALNADLAELRFGIVGCGATGSATAMLLARLGARRLLAVDRDVVDVTNLNRLHGASAADAAKKRLKVDVLKRHVEAMGLGAEVITHPGWVGDEACRDAIRSCDVVFGCTDDHEGRLFLNRLAYFYLQPVFDVGFKLDVDDGDPPRILDAAGRVTVLVPGTRCLLCRNVVDPNLAREEHIRRTSPEEYAWQHEQRYVRGEAGPSPAVVTFTTDLACMAIDELLHRLTGYRRAGSVDNRVRKYHLIEDKRPGPSHDNICSICLQRAYWGRGDITPFLDRVG